MPLELVVHLHLHLVGYSYSGAWHSSFWPLFCYREIYRKQASRFTYITLFNKMSLLKRNLYLLNHCLNAIEMWLCTFLNGDLEYLHFKYCSQWTEIQRQYTYLQTLYFWLNNTYISFRNTDHSSWLLYYPHDTCCPSVGSESNRQIYIITHVLTVLFSSEQRQCCQISILFLQENGKFRDCCMVLAAPFADKPYRKLSNAPISVPPALQIIQFMNCVSHLFKKAYKSMIVKTLIFFSHRFSSVS